MYSNKDAARRRCSENITMPVPGVIDDENILKIILERITDKWVKGKVRLVCKMWNEMAQSFLTWNKVVLNVGMRNNTDLEPKPLESQSEIRIWTASPSTIVEIVRGRKHITEYALRRVSFYNEWWSDIVGVMQHVRWLSLIMGVEIGEVHREAFALTDLPSLTYLHIDGAHHPLGLMRTSSITLRLPSLTTLRLSENKSRAIFRHEGLCRMDIDCPSLRFLEFRIHVALPLKSTWFERPQSIELFVHKVFIDHKGCHD